MAVDSISFIHSYPHVKSETLGQVEAAIDRFLSQRGVEDFIVRVLLLDGNPVALVLADAQRRLRYSNVLEEMIRRSIAEELPGFVQAHSLMVFWRYRLESDGRSLEGPIVEHSSHLPERAGGGSGGGK